MKVFSFKSAANTCFQTWAKIDNRLQIKTPQNNIAFPDGSNERRNTYSRFATGSGPKMSERELQWRERVRRRPQQNSSFTCDGITSETEHQHVRALEKLMNMQRHLLHFHQQCYGHERTTVGALGEVYSPLRQRHHCLCVVWLLEA